MTTQELRNKAANVIKRRGWCKGAYSINGRVCLLGALSVAHGGDPDDVLSPIADEALMEMGFVGQRPAFHWNDAPERRAKEVIARLRGVSA